MKITRAEIKLTVPARARNVSTSGQTAGGAEYSLRGGLIFHSMAAIVIGLTLCLAATTALAQVNVTMPWLRSTAPGQKTSVAFMQLEAHVASDVALLSASSPLAVSVELRDVRRVKGVLRPIRVQKLDIPAGSGLELKPGRAHLVLLGLARPIRRGEWIPITLVFEARDAPRFSVEIRAEAMRANAKSHWHRH